MLVQVHLSPRTRGNAIQFMWYCKYCNQSFNFDRSTEKANHTRHCDSNPEKHSSYTNVKLANAARANQNFGKIKIFHVKCCSCEHDFQVKERERLHPVKEQYFCSRKCANSVGGKAKAIKYHYDEVAHYTTVAWRYHEKKCIVCGEKRIVAVHHLNEVHTDNRPENLIPLCPTHHQFMHSRHRGLIQNQVNSYLRDKWG